MIKEEIIRLVEKMPDDCTVEDIIYELYFKQKVDKGLQDIQNEDVVPHEEVVQRMEKWLK